MLPFSVVNPVDFAVLEAIQLTISPLLTSLMLLVTFLGNPIFWVLVAAVIYWKGEERKSFLLMNLVIFSSGAVALLKPLFARPRPSSPRFAVIRSPLERLYHMAGFDFSFPSGHTTLISSMFFYLRRGSSRWNWLLLGVVAVGFSRIYLGRHFLTDVIAAVAVGYAIGKANHLIKKYFEGEKFRLTKLKKELAFFVTLIAALIVVVFLRTASLSMVLFGYYSGLFLFKSLNLDSRRVKGKEFYLKAAAGAAVLVGAVFGALLLPLPVAAEYAVFFISGLWISFLWPFLYDRVLKKSRQ